MPKIYATLIELGYKTIDDVPSIIRDKVQAMLDENINQ